jgi:hypothetical protein
MRKSYAGANMVDSRAEYVFILKHYVALKLFSDVLEAFSKECPDKDVRNKIIIQLVTTFRDTGSVCL